MSRQDDSSTQMKAAVVTGIFAVIAAVIGGVFLLLNTALTPLPDSVKYFQIVETSGNKVVIEVGYTYDRIHGNDVYVGAWFLDKGKMVGGGGYVPAHAPSESGVARVTIHPDVTSQQTSDEVEIILYERGKSHFVSKRFPFVYTFEP